MFEVGADGAGENTAFNISAALFQVSGGAFVGDSFHILFDNGAFIQIGGGVMSGGADHFHAAFPSSAVGVAAHESGEKSVVDIDDF